MFSSILKSNALLYWLLEVTILEVTSLVSHPSPFSGTVFGADLLKSHIYAGVHFSTEDQPKEFLFYCISYGHAIERTWTPECVF